MNKHLFLGANTPDGFVHYFDSIVSMFDLKKLYILKGGNGIGKSTFIKNFAEKLHITHSKTLTDSPLAKGGAASAAGGAALASGGADCDVIWIHCPADPKSLDGAIIESLGIGIIDGTAPHMIDPQYPGIIDEIVNLGDFIDPARLDITRAQIDDINTQKRELYRAAYDALARARALHHELENSYKDAVDFAAINALCNKLITSAKTDAGETNLNRVRENSTK